MKRKPILFATLLANLSLLAQITTMDSVEVTANRLVQLNETTGRNITVLHAQEIASMPVNSLDELLRQIPGLNVNSRMGFGVQSDIGMRGSTFSQVLVLIDGVRLNDPLTGHFNSYIPLALSEIDRIEVVRGPAAAAYGADAVGGMIHIKTRSYTEGNTRQIATRGTLGMGDHSLRTSDLALDAKSGTFRLSMAYRSAQSDGETFSNPNYGLNPAADSIYRSHFNLNTLSAALSFRPTSALRIYLRSGIDQRAFDAKYFYTGSNWDESYEQVNSFWSQAAVEFDKGKHASKLQIGFKDNRDSFDFNPLFPANDHRTLKTFLNLSHTYRFRSDRAFMLGIQNELSSIESTDRGEHQSNNLGVYAIYTHRIGDLHSTTSLRMEQHPNFGIEILPQLSLAWIRGAQRFRFAYGKAIRAADFTERYIASQFDTLTPGRNLGNPDLRAERSHTLEIGTDRELASLEFGFTYFYRWSTDLIDFARSSGAAIGNVSPYLFPNADYLYATNISESETQGVELTMARTFEVDRSQLRPQLGITWLRTSNADSVISKYIANHPDLTINYSFDFRNGPIAVRVDNQFIRRSGEQNPSILGSIPSELHIANLRLSFVGEQDLYRIYLQARNLFNVEYQEILGARMPGRWLAGGIAWNL